MNYFFVTLRANYHKMKFFRFIGLICFAVISCSLIAQNQRELGQLMRERGEYYFTLAVNEPTEIQSLSRLCSVDGTNGQTVVCYANQEEYDQLLQLGYQPNLQTPPSLLTEAKMWDGNRATYEWDSYPTYSQYETMMEEFPTSAVSGRTCTLMELGTLSSGRKIMGVRLNNGSPEGKPKFLYSSTIHGDETTGWILMLRLIDELCTSTDPRIVNLIDNLDIFIFPNTNPDGTYYRGNNSVTGARRYNANGVDMNRNYPDPHGSAHPDGKPYQSETQWLMQLAMDYPFVMAANYHGGSEVVNYPWDNTHTLHADDDWWQYVSREYADLAQSVNSNYMNDLDNGITNGAQWYMIGGGRQDYMNGYRQCREVTIECSTTKKPQGSQLPNFWDYNHNSMLTYMEECLNGVHGFVYDAATGQPLEGVTITVQGHDDEYSIVSSHEVGDFHRPIKGGTYTFVFSKEGYLTQTVEVTVADGQRIELNDIQLLPLIDRTLELVQGWNWWAPLVEMTVDDLETALGTNGIVVNSQDAGYLRYENGAWVGTLTAIVPGQMYKIQTGEACIISQSGSYVPVSYTFYPGYNWFGYQGTQPLAIEDINITPTEGDKINSQNDGYAIFENGLWNGTLELLQPGHGYVYMSNAIVPQTLSFPIAK